MKKFLSILLVLAVFLTIAVIPASAAACFRCNGAGKYTCDDCKGRTTCRFCEGSGVNDDGQPCQACINNPGVCARCGGSGMETCPDCHGSGVDPNSPPETTAATTAAPAATTAAPADTTAAPNDTPAPSGDYGKTDVSYGAVALPGDRQSTMYLGTPGIDNDDYAGTTATGAVRYEEMTPEQQEVYNSIPDDQLAQILGNVQGIISTVKVGDTADESKPFVDAFMKENGIEKLDDANIIPITFDGHIEIGFPVQVSVEVEPGRFDGSKPLHVFHIAADGTITQIPDENVNWITKEDGSVGRVEFYTDTFSDFLITDTEGLVIPKTADIAGPDEPVITPGATEKSNSAIKIIAIVAVVLIAIGALVFFLVKNRKTPDPIDEIKDPIDEIPEPETEEKKDE